MFLGLCPVCLPFLAIFHLVKFNFFNFTHNQSLLLGYDILKLQGSHDKGDVY